MLIGSSSNKPSLKTIRRLKNTLRKALDLPDEAIVTVTQLACLELGCAPLETVFGLLQANQPQLQHKVHKATETVDVDDLKQVCQVWGFNTQKTVIDSFFKENE